MERKEAIEVIKKNYPHCAESGTQFETALRTLIPELKDSEDEEIILAMINFFKSERIKDGIAVLHFGVNIEKMIAWLEKQGKQKSIDDLTQQDAMDIAVAKCFEQSEQKPTSDTRHEVKAGDSLSVVNGKPFDYEHATITQKDFASKVEPKFHEGDFIKHNKANIICKVISVNSGSYCVENIETSGRIELFNAEQIFHPWTIQDAKAGDVLVCCDNKPFIFKGFFGLNFANCLAAYCGITLENQFRHCNGKTFWTNQDVKPATKEQRDVLMRAMADAGYTFDFEKKELNKIEQKFTTMTLDEAIKHCEEKSCGNDACALEHKQLKKWLTELKELKEQKPAWSEEDECHMNLCINAIATKDGWTFEEKVIEKHWFKSLKYRVLNLANSAKTCKN